MAEEPQSLRSCFIEAEKNRQCFESGLDTSSASSQSTLSAAICKYQTCDELVDEVSMFSPNESLEDVSSGDLQYFLIHFYLAELNLRRTNGERRSNLNYARKSFEKFLKLLDSYDALGAEDYKTLERYWENPSRFSTASTADAAQRRQTKIARFKEERALRSKLEYLRQRPATLEADDAVVRSLHLTNARLCLHQAFQSLESIAQELELLSPAPSPPQGSLDASNLDSRYRERSSRDDENSERLESRSSHLLSSNRSGPILDQAGKPLRPFTLLDHRQRLQQGVFRPDHSLPTMTIDEYLEEERKRGGMIDGGGAQSQSKEAVDDDDMAKADEATMKARAWDEFTEENPKGAGNTMNMG